MRNRLRSISSVSIQVKLLHTYMRGAGNNSAGERDTPHNYFNTIVHLSVHLSLAENVTQAKNYWSLTGHCSGTHTLNSEQLIVR